MILFRYVEKRRLNAVAVYFTLESDIQIRAHIAHQLLLQSIYPCTTGMVALFLCVLYFSPERTPERVIEI